jgi:hypothetical protein
MIKKISNDRAVLRKLVTLIIVDHLESSFYLIDEM